MVAGRDVAFPHSSPALLLPCMMTEGMDMQGFGRVAPSSGAQQGSGFQQGQSYGGQSQGGQGYGSQSQGGQSFGGQSGGGSSDSKYNASHALADQGIAEQAAFVGSKTVGHHNIPHYDEEDPKLPAAVGAMSGSNLGQKGGDSRGDNLPSQAQVTAVIEGQPTGQVHAWPGA